MPEAKAIWLNEVSLLKQAETIFSAPFTGRSLSRRASAHGGRKQVHYPPFTRGIFFA
jgi:hypothetical protein